jgi:hypothetical protein
VAITPLKRQLEEMKEALASAKPQGKDALEELCRVFRHGLVVSSPYPAKISDADEMLNRLYGLVVSPVPEIRRASSQKMFEHSLKKALEAFVHAGWPKARIQEIGRRNVGGILINIGLRTQISQTVAALWHPISLQSESKPEAQLATAKATILDIIQTRTRVEQYKTDRQYVAVLAPRAKSARGMDDIVGSLKAAADQVLIANDNETLMAQVQYRLQALGTRRAAK